MQCIALQGCIVLRPSPKLGSNLIRWWWLAAAGRADYDVVFSVLHVVFCVLCVFHCVT